ncbi:MAG TPA: peptidase M56, partial [Epulopiscium sp.]|nr:peptidase M56 [Candidatus Epulonipiscium sp.]
MDQLFLKIMNMSLTTSYVILLVILIRLLLRKVPKIYSYSLWIIVLFRLLVPFSFSSVFSMIPMASNPIPADIIYAPRPEIHSGITRVDKVVNNSLPAPVADASVNPIQIWILLGEIIWLAGILMLLIYSILTTLKLARKLKSSQHFKDNIYKTN